MTNLQFPTFTWKTTLFLCLQKQSRFEKRPCNNFFHPTPKNITGFLFKMHQNNLNSNILLFIKASFDLKNKKFRSDLNYLTLCFPKEAPMQFYKWCQRTLVPRYLSAGFFIVNRKQPAKKNLLYNSFKKEQERDLRSSKQ